jgi:ribosomal protein L3 glutamine methyltransferase
VAGGDRQTVAEALAWCEAQLRAHELWYGHGTDNPWDEAVQLVLAAAALPPDADRSVLDHLLTPEQGGRLRGWVARRVSERVPLPYLTGRAWFAGLPFVIDERAIIPRSPLAELVQNEFRPWLQPAAGPLRILDLCCGSGCIGIAAAHYIADAQVELADIDAAALQLARENVALHGVTERVRVTQSDLFEALAGRHYDVIVSNPPYVDADDLAAMPPEYQHEPALALGSGSDGLDITRRILRDAAAHLTDRGLLVVEVGNSWQALEQAYPDVPFTWVEFEHGGHGVFVLTAQELREYSARLAG